MIPSGFADSVRRLGDDWAAYCRPQSWFQHGRARKRDEGVMYDLALIAQHSQVCKDDQTLRHEFYAWGW